MECFKALQSSNTISTDALKLCFTEICAASATDNKTTSMYLSRDKVAEILAKHGVQAYAGVLDLLTSNGSVYTPSLVSLLQATRYKERKFALIIVDVQNDFITGSLAVGEGELVVPVINKLGTHFKHVYKTVDWHPANHISFFSNVKSGLYPTAEDSAIKGADSNIFETVTVAGPPALQQTLWPDHCVQGSTGSELHADLAVFPDEQVVKKGYDCMVDSYSGFWDNGDTAHTSLYGLMLEEDITDVVVCGLASDYCVGFTALDAQRHGFRTVLAQDAIRGVAPDTTQNMLARCKAANIDFLDSAAVPGLLAAGYCEQETVERVLAAKEHFSAAAR